MLSQEKEEHKIATLSRATDKRDTEDDKVDRRGLTALPDGQPAGERRGGRGDTIGWSTEAVSEVDTSYELDYLNCKIESLTHQVNVYKLTEQNRKDEANAYRLKCFLEDEKEQQRIAELEPTPLLLTRGVQTEGLHLTPPQKTRLDWFSFTAKEDLDILKQFCNIVLPGCFFENLNHGTQGYKAVCVISLNGEKMGQINYCGTTERNHFFFSGNGCEKVLDWSVVYFWLKLLNEPKITVVHICFDDYEGKFVNREIYEQAYIDGDFKSKKSRHNPMREPKEKFFGDGFSMGRTTNIGKSKSFTKCCTGYEKGCEQFLSLFSKMPVESQRTMMEKLTLSDLSFNFPSGVNLDISILKWYRVEVKLSNQDVVIPLEVILHNDKFFAGAYPFTDKLLSLIDPNIEKAKPMRLPTNSERFIEEMFVNAGNSYGSSLYTALMLANSRGEDLQDYCVEMVKKMIQGHCSPNQKIIKTGALLDLKPFDPKVLDNNKEISKPVEIFKPVEIVEKKFILKQKPKKVYTEEEKKLFELGRNSMPDFLKAAKAEKANLVK